jgi:hypothetical protein
MRPSPFFHVCVIQQKKSEVIIRLSSGSSDARVPANEIVGCEPGELFVHRNVANLVVNNDNSLQSVFQYAVEYLQVRRCWACVLSVMMHLSGGFHPFILYTEMYTVLCCLFLLRIGE